MYDARNLVTTVARWLNDITKVYDTRCRLCLLCPVGSLLIFPLPYPSPLFMMDALTHSGAWLANADVRTHVWYAVGGREATTVVRHVVRGV